MLLLLLLLLLFFLSFFLNVADVCDVADFYGETNIEPENQWLEDGFPVGCELLALGRVS